MQEIRTVGGGRMFGGGDRRLRLHHHPTQALKCPRCDSLNTKFCYYNNYNLSQPRHFCKSCRRYWTKGGILRNVPVGGGCRKAKRSRSKPPPPSSDDAEAESPRPKKAASRSSSSESSSLTAATAAAAASCSSSSSALFGASFLESRFFLPQSSTNPNPNPNLEPAPEAEAFPELGAFSSLFTDPAILSYNQRQSVRNRSNWQLPNQEPKMQDTSGYPPDQAVQNEPPAGVQATSGDTGSLPPFVWESGGEQDLYGLSAAVDQGYYWTQDHWTAGDHPLYLP